MLNKLILSAAILAAASSAFAHDESSIDKTVQLPDGSSVYVFKDGTMAMEDQFGRSVQMAPGQTMRTRDGKTITMVGNETARLDCIKRMMLGA